jgi:hypothetical protein
MVQRDSVFLTDFALTDGASVDLQLHRVEIFAPDAILVLATQAGDVPMAAPEVAMLSGQIVGQPESRVFLAISPEAVNGVVNAASDRYIVSCGPYNQGYQPLIYSVSQTPADLIPVDGFACHYDELVQPGLSKHSAESAAGLRGSEPCRIADISVETDWEFHQLFGNEAGAAAYAATLIGAVSEIYVADADMHLRISYLRIWTTSADPWTQGDTVNQLFEFQDYWNLNMTGIGRHVATMLSGRGLGGGVAYGDAACYPEYDYSVEANLAGWFPYPLEDNNANNWDMMVTAHELGHNFGAPHTHDIGIDNCAGGDCSVAPNGTIMSYCHLCDGGLANILLNFHPLMLSSEILPFLNSGQCDLSGAAPSITGGPNGGAFCVGADISLSVFTSGPGTHTYQWRKDGSDIGGATSGTYLISGAVAADAGDYDVVVGNECASITSGAAGVTVAAGAAGDVNGDCAVNITDLGTLLAVFGTCSGDAGYDAAADLDASGCVNITDLGILLANFGA